MSEVPKLSRNERLRLIAFRNVQEPKIKKDKIMSEKEKRILELELAEEKLTNEMNDFFKRVQFSNQFTDSDKVSVKENIDFYYHKSLRNLNPKSDLNDVVLVFNDNMENAMKNRIDGVDKIELKEYLKLILKLYNIGIEKEYLKLA